MLVGILHRVRSRKRKTKNYVYCAILGYYVASGYKFLPTFRNNYRSHRGP
jgi:hypothetical protein